ncbi:MAG TPA: NADH-quinone oxidoreductase subunit F, partial [Thauera sp.]|nr:NADH-quinone oxidoreductase subunit F [Thauera sp.]
MADTTTAPDPAVRRKTRATQRGRQLDPAALADIEALLAGRPRARDTLIEHLHAIQDTYGHLALRHLRALAHWMNLPMAAVFETATFYAHFDIVRDGEIPPPEVTIRVCDSLSCELAGARALQAALADGVDPARVRVLRAPCMGRCDSAPVVEVGHRHLGHASPAAVRALLQGGELHPERIAWQGLEAYRAEGGYALLEALRAGEVSVERLSDVLQDAGLRGLGGAGFPTFKKWAFVRA